MSKEFISRKQAKKIARRVGQFLLALILLACFFMFFSDAYAQDNDVPCNGTCNGGDTTQYVNVNTGDTRINNSVNNSTRVIDNSVTATGGTSGDSTSYANAAAGDASSYAEGGQGGSGGVASAEQSQTATGGNATGGNATGGNASNSGVSVNNSSNYKQKRQAPPVYAPIAMPTSPCRIGISSGASIPGGGFSIGGSVEDDGCSLREDVRLLWNLGLTDTAQLGACYLDSVERFGLTQECLENAMRQIDKRRVVATTAAADCSTEDARLLKCEAKLYGGK